MRKLINIQVVWFGAASAVPFCMVPLAGEVSFQYWKISCSQKKDFFLQCRMNIDVRGRSEIWIPWNPVFWEFHSRKSVDIIKPWYGWIYCLLAGLFKNSVHVRFSLFGVDFEVSLQKFRFGPVSMGVHRGYSCNDLMLLAALKLVYLILYNGLQFVATT